MVDILIGPIEAAGVALAAQVQADSDDSYFRNILDNLSAAIYVTDVTPA
jgi:hypothetical protein